MRKVKIHTCERWVCVPDQVSRWSSRAIGRWTRTERPPSPASTRPTSAALRTSASTRCPCAYLVDFSPPLHSWADVFLSPVITAISINITAAQNMLLLLLLTSLLSIFGDATMDLCGWQVLCRKKHQHAVWVCGLRHSNTFHRYFYFQYARKKYKNKLKIIIAIIGNRITAFFGQIDFVAQFNKCYLHLNQMLVRLGGERKQNLDAALKRMVFVSKIKKRGTK